MTVSKFEFTDAGFLAVRKGTISLEADTIVAVLVDAAQTPDITSDATFVDVAANECASTDYLATYAEGHVVANLAWTDVGTRIFMLDADNLDYGNSVNISAQYVYLIKRAGANLVASDLIVGYVDLKTEGGNVTSISGNFNLAWPATGLYRDTVT
jgi:hypothetical protein